MFLCTIALLSTSFFSWGSLLYPSLPSSLPHHSFLFKAEFFFDTSEIFSSFQTSFFASVFFSWDRVGVVAIFAGIESGQT